MKQNIGIGNVVDDGRGDYLRRGGEKINNNFNELYADLGDGNVPHPAGAWKTHERTSTSGTDKLNPTFGQAYNINTTRGSVTVKLPNGNSADYGRVIKLRDVWGVWGTNIVTIEATGNNTIKGGSVPRKLLRDYQDVELVFASPGNWDYIDNKLIGRLSNSEQATVAKREFIATQGQTDFTDIFGETPYNPKNMEVYRRGNLMYYGETFGDNSDYGSVGVTSTDIVPLDGKSLRVRYPLNEGDVITIVTYLDDLAVYKTSYTAKTIKVYGKDFEGAIESGEGQVWVGDLSTKRIWDLSEFGLSEIDGQLNPFSTEVQINGRDLIRAGNGGLPAFTCEISGVVDHSIGDEDLCKASAGTWGESGIDFSPIKDSLGRYTKLKIYEPLESGDMLTVKWYNNDIGTTMDWDEIRSEADEVYLNNEYRFSRSNRIRYNDFDNPNPCTSEIETEVEDNVKFTDISSLLESIYPIGSIYMNAHNPNNPEKYMGFGRWVPYAKGKVPVGWDDGDDPNFSQYVGECGTLTKPGGSGGAVEHEIKISEVPTISSEEKVLIKDDNGDVLIGQCLLDPSDDGPGYRKYREDKLQSNVNSGVVNLNILQPYVTVAMWLRVA